MLHMLFIFQEAFDILHALICPIFIHSLYTTELGFRRNKQRQWDKDLFFALQHKFLLEAAKLDLCLATAYKKQHINASGTHHPEALKEMQQLFGSMSAITSSFSC